MTPDMLDTAEGPLRLCLHALNDTPRFNTCDRRIDSCALAARIETFLATTQKKEIS